MNTIRLFYHLARADFYERTRRYSFLIMLGLIVYLGYAVNTGDITLKLDNYRGVFNSAWVGSMTAVVINFFVGWFGFYLIKNSVARDYETGVGQIIAATPLSRGGYMLGKWLSNFGVLSSLVGIMAVAAVLFQLIQREDPVLNLWALLAPFLFMVLPLMALVAALAVLFEAIPWLRGGLGNFIYFWLFTFLAPASFFLAQAKVFSVLEPLGMGLFYSDMGTAAKAAYPNYQGGFNLTTASLEGVATQTFYWPGLNWTAEIVAGRLAIFALALGVVGLAALFFDRFDSARAEMFRPKASQAPPPTEAVAPLPMPLTVSLLPAVQPGFRLLPLLWAELRLMLKGQRWWWYAIALILIAFGLFTPAQDARQNILPVTWIWPLLIWSAMGGRELRHRANQIVFSAAQPLTRQLPATWLAGVLVAALTGSGVGLRLLASGDWFGVAAWGVALVFIPSLALACGIWSGSSKLFEVVYTVIWYLGPLNHAPMLDYMGATSNAQPLIFLFASGVLIGLAVWGRRRQMQTT